MKKNISLFIVTLLIGCNATDNKKTNTNIHDQTMAVSSEIENTDSKNVLLEKVIPKLNEISLPMKITSSSVESKVDITNDNNWKDWFPKKLTSSLIQEVTVLGMLNLDVDRIALLCSLNFEEDEDDEVYAMISQKMLLVYDKNANYLSNITVSIDEYGHGYSIVNENKDVLYIYSSEMENINISHKKYTFRKGDYELVEEMSKSFEGSEKGFKLSNEHMNMLENSI